MYKTYCDNKVLQLKDLLMLETKTLLQAKLYARLRKEETGREYYIKTDGIKIWDTLEGDNSNITSL